ncbi:MAG: peptidase M16 [Myxococcaceae bacterium]
MSALAFEEKLPSGLTVVTVETPHLHSAMCSAYVRVGSRHEDEESNGVSHLLEHLFFRGSRRFPDSVKMNAAVEAVGGNLNAVTMRDSSFFYTPTHPDGVPVALGILGDMLARPRLVQLETEKKIILEEMLDEVDERGRDIDVDNLSKRLVYGKHPLALKIAGTPRTVKAMTARQVRRHFEAAYVTGNVVVAVAGPVKHRRVVEEVARAFRHLPGGSPLTEAPAPPTRREGPTLKYVSLEEAQVEFRLTFPAVSDAHPDFAALSMLRRVLDDGLSSRLPYNVVEKRGLAYSIGATVEVFHDAGSFEVDGATAPKQLGKVVEEVLETLATLRAGRVTPEELRRAKKRHAMHVDFLLDSPAELCGWFGGTRLFRKPESFAQRIDEANAVTLAELKRVAREYLVADTLAVVAVGPRSARKSLERVSLRARSLLGK